MVEVVVEVVDVEEIEMVVDVDFFSNFVVVVVILIFV